MEKKWCAYNHDKAKVIKNTQDTNLDRTLKIAFYTHIPIERTLANTNWHQNMTLNAQRI